MTEGQKTNETDAAKLAAEEEAKAKAVAEAEAEAKAKAESNKAAEKYFVITIGTTNDPMGDVDAQVGVNGVMTRIRRETPVAVSESAIEVLNNGVQTRYFKKKDPNTKEPVMVPRSVKTYPYQVHSEHKTKDAAEKAAKKLQAEMEYEE